MDRIAPINFRLRMIESLKENHRIYKTESMGRVERINPVLNVIRDKAEKVEEEKKEVTKYKGVDIGQHIDIFV